MAFARARGAVRLGAVAAAVVISGSLTALPALASGASTPQSAGKGGSQFGALALSLQNTLLPRTSGAQAEVFHKTGVGVLAEDEPLSGVKVTVDASKAAGIAEIQLPSTCSWTDAAKLHASCKLGTVDFGANVEIGVRAAAGAAVGAHGSISYAVTATDATLDKTFSKDPLATSLTVGHGFDLAVGPLSKTIVVPTAGTTVSPAVANLGDQETKGGVSLILSADADFALGGNFSNCRYDVLVDGDPTTDPGTMVCHFDTVVAPGQTLRLSAGVPVTTRGPSADGPSPLIYGWDAEGGMIDAGFTGGKAGTGAPLALVPVASPRLAPQPQDIDYGNNLGFSQLAPFTPDDVAVVSHDVRGTVGRNVTARFGVRNTGTAPTRPMKGAPLKDITAAVAVMLPKGVSVVAHPANCWDYTKELSSGGGSMVQPRMRSMAASVPQPGSLWVCGARGVLKPGQEADVALTLKAAKALTSEGMAMAASAQDDMTPDDNAAAFAVVFTGKAPVSAPKPSAPASSPAAAGGTGGGTGGGLAHTGGGSDTLPLLAAGAGAVLLGAGAVLLTRRRKASQGSHG